MKDKNAARLSWVPALAITLVLQRDLVTSIVTNAWTVLIHKALSLLCLVVEFTRSMVKKNGFSRVMWGLAQVSCESLVWMPAPMANNYYTITFVSIHTCTCTWDTWSCMFIHFVTFAWDKDASGKCYTWTPSHAISSISCVLVWSLLCKGVPQQTELFFLHAGNPRVVCGDWLRTEAVSKQSPASTVCCRGSTVPYQYSLLLRTNEALDAASKLRSVGGFLATIGALAWRGKGEHFQLCCHRFSIITQACVLWYRKNYTFWTFFFLPKMWNK